MQLSIPHTMGEDPRFAARIAPKHLTLRQLSNQGKGLLEGSHELEVDDPAA